MPGIGHLSAGMSFRAPRYRYLRFFENMKKQGGHTVDTEHPPYKK